MPFPPAVRAKALAAAGRCCCICHEFSGLKVECHHIVQEADGGPNSFDNCIPVCLNCHADMRSYDSKHPRGTKYSTIELREHRDRWYAKVAGSGGMAVASQHVGVDREVFAGVREQLPYEPALDYLKHHFGGRIFHLEQLQPLFAYTYVADRPENEFLDAELETARGALVAAIRRLDLALGQHTFPMKGMPGRINCVPEEWQIEQPTRFEKAIGEIHAAGTDVAGAHARLVRLGRRRLDVA